MNRKSLLNVIFIIIILSIMCGLAITEMIATKLPRNLNFEIHSKRYSSYRPEIGIITNKPNSTQVISSPWVYNTISYNKYGFRGPNWPLNKTHGELRIAILGDSYIEGREVKNDELVTIKLEKFIGKGSLVMNCGLSGTGPAEQILLYKNFVKKFKPDIVIQCMTPSNDFEDNVRELSNFRQKNYFELRDDKLLAIPLPGWVIFFFSPPINSITNCLLNLTFLKLVKLTMIDQYHALFTTPMNVGATQEDPTLTPLRAFGNEGYDHAKRIMREAIVSLERMCTDDGSRFLLVSASGCWTFKAQEDPAFIPQSEYLSLRYKWVEQFAKEHSVPYIDLNKAILELYKSRKLKSAELHIPWDGHWTPLGHRLAAESIYAFLNDHSYLAEIKQSP